MRLRHVFSALNMELSSQDTTKDVPNQTRTEDLVLILLDRSCLKFGCLIPVAASFKVLDAGCLWILGNVKMP